MRKTPNVLICYIKIEGLPIFGEFIIHIKQNNKALHLPWSIYLDADDTPQNIALMTVKIVYIQLYGLYA